MYPPRLRLQKSTESIDKTTMDYSIWKMASQQVDIIRNGRIFSACSKNVIFLHRGFLTHGNMIY